MLVYQKSVCLHQLTVRDTTILDKNLETLWKILLPFVFPLPFATLLQPCNFEVTSQHCRGKGTCIGVSGIFGEDCVRCKRPSGYHYTLFRRGGMLEEIASMTYSLRCFDFKGFKFMTRISFLAIFTAQIFENCFSISRRKNYNTNFIQNRELTKKTRVWSTLLISNSRPNAVNAELYKT